MIKFFRKIRRKILDEGSLKRYIIYAIGEIILVVIGILIAVQLNNWNQFNSEVISLFNLNSKTHIATIKDVTYWDGLVKYTQTRNKSWFNDFIVGEFDSYEVDYIGIFGA